MIEFRFYIPLDTKWVISDMLFPANLLTSTEQTKSKPGETTSKVYNKPRLMQITTFTTTKNNHAYGTQKYYNSK